MQHIYEKAIAFISRPRTRSAAATFAAAVFCSLVSASSAIASIQVLAITSATDFRTTAIAPGSLASVWCTGLTGISGIVAAPGPILPAQLAGVTVYAGGATNAPILAVADLGGYQLINIQIPWDAAGFNAIAVAQGSEKATANMINTGEWPVFFIDASGSIIAQHATDYSLVTAKNPARRGEWIVGYASNLGPVSNTPPTGVPAPQSPLSILNPAPVTSAGSVPEYSVVVAQPDQQVVYQTQASQSNFMGLAPYTVGVYQINFQVPDNAPAGDAIVYLRRNVDCGFVFVQGCGKGLTFTLSNAAKLPVAP